MKRFKQHTPLVISEFERNIWEFPPHNHNYIEIIHIKEGKGKHIINDIRFEYKKDDIFLIAPNDIHTFEIEKKTRFCYLKFTEFLFTKEGNIPEKVKWMQKIEAILYHPNLIPGDILYAQEDKQHIIYLIKLILKEHHTSQNYSAEIIEDAISTILSLFARNICYLYCKKDITIDTSQNIINEIRAYIRHHIYEPQKVRIDSIASSFHKSKNYISIFFKRHTGESLQQYILNYRMMLAENRIKKTDYTIAEIAFQLGYTDESHLIKHFKQKYDIPPGEYRKKNL